MKIQICDLIIESDYCPASFYPFRAEGEAQLVIAAAAAPAAVGSPVAVHQDFFVYRQVDGWVYQTPLGEQLWVSDDYSRAALWLPPEAPSREQETQVLLLLRIVIECRLADFGALSLHSACVRKDGKAVAFTGESGRGKSTRAAQWVQTLDAQWLSGDRPSISLAGPTAWGVPWDGKEQLFCNERAPLAAILEVRRGSFTRLRRLSRTQARRVLMEQCFLPMWDSDRAACIMALIGRLVERVPVCRLVCHMDAQAARETFHILYEDPKSILSEETDLKIKEGFVLRRLVGEYMVMPTGENVAKFQGSVALNEVAAFIFEKLRNPISRDDLLALLCSEYEVEQEIAARDLDGILETFRSFGLLQEQP